MNFFLARHPTDPTFIFLLISITMDDILCITHAFYQLLFILPSFNVLSLIFNSLAAAEFYSAGNTRINEYGSFVERNCKEEKSQCDF